MVGSAPAAGRVKRGCHVLPHEAAHARVEARAELFVVRRCRPALFKVILAARFAGHCALAARRLVQRGKVLGVERLPDQRRKPCAGKEHSLRRAEPKCGAGHTISEIVCPKLLHAQLLVQFEARWPRERRSA